MGERELRRAGISYKQTGNKDGSKKPDHALPEFCYFSAATNPFRLYEAFVYSPAPFDLFPLLADAVSQPSLV